MIIMPLLTFCLIALCIMVFGGMAIWWVLGKIGIVVNSVMSWLSWIILVVILAMAIYIYQQRNKIADDYKKGIKAMSPQSFYKKYNSTIEEVQNRGWFFGATHRRK